MPMSTRPNFVTVATVLCLMQASRSPRLHGCEALPLGAHAQSHGITAEVVEHTEARWFNVTIPPSGEPGFDGTHSLYVHAIIDPDEVGSPKHQSS